MIRLASNPGNNLDSGGDQHRFKVARYRAADNCINTGLTDTPNLLGKKRFGQIDLSAGSLASVFKIDHK
jgi:hypothetical protein